jgi:hypothetical protein
MAVSDGILTALSSFNITVSTASTRTFANAANIAIIDTAAAFPYPSAINVSGMDGTVTNVTVQLNRFNHPWGGDVDALLISPTGQKVLIMSDAGTGPTANATLTFSDAAPLSLPQTGVVATGTYRPTNYDTLTDIFPPPAPPLRMAIRYRRSMAILPTASGFSTFMMICLETAATSAAAGRSRSRPS